MAEKWYHDGSEDEELAQPPEGSVEYKLIEKVAAIVAWEPAAELFVMQIMLGSKEFEFLNPENEYHEYYLQRVYELQMRPRPLYVYTSKLCKSSRSFLNVSENEHTSLDV